MDHAHIIIAVVYGQTPPNDTCSFSLSERRIYMLILFVSEGVMSYLGAFDLCVFKKPRFRCPSCRFQPPALWRVFKKSVLDGQSGWKAKPEKRDAFSNLSRLVFTLLVWTGPKCNIFLLNAVTPFVQRPLRVT